MCVCVCSCLTTAIKEGGEGERRRPASDVICAVSLGERFTSSPFFFPSFSFRSFFLFPQPSRFGFLCVWPLLICIAHVALFLFMAAAVVDPDFHKNSRPGAGMTIVDDNVGTMTPY